MSEQIHDPNRRQWYEFRRDGDAMIVTIRVAPGGDVPPHLHPSQEERWTVVEGDVRFKVGGRTIKHATPGEELVVAPTVRHSFKNVGRTDATLVAEVRPALEIEGFLRDSAALAREGAYDRRGLIKSPSAAVKVAALIERYEHVAVILWPPRFLQRYMLAPMLRRARARGKAPNGAPIGG